MRALALLCAIAACSGPHPRPTGGRTRDAAIDLTLAPGSQPDMLVVEHDGPGIALPHWYRLRLGRPSHLVATAGGGFSVDVIGADGEAVGNVETPVSRDVILRVDGHTPPYRLRVTATAVQPVVELPPDADAGPPACDKHDVDPTNPNCAGVVPCDPNNPDFKNEVCCGCTTCNGPFERIAGTIYGWVPLGARDGIARGFRASFTVMTDGKPREAMATVVEVERNRSKIAVAADPVTPISGSLELHAPKECDWVYLRYRDR